VFYSGSATTSINVRTNWPRNVCGKIITCLIFSTELKSNVQNVKIAWNHKVHNHGEGRYGTGYCQHLFGLFRYFIIFLVLTPIGLYSTQMLCEKNSNWLIFRTVSSFHENMYCICASQPNLNLTVFSAWYHTFECLKEY